VKLYFLFFLTRRTQNITQIIRVFLCKNLSDLKKGILHSKSGHFGGVVSIPSTHTNFFFIKKIIIKDIKKNIIHKKYILNVSPKFSAE